MNTVELLETLYARGAQLAVQDGQLRLSAPDGALDEALIALVRQDRQALIALLEQLDQAGGVGPSAPPTAHPAAYTSLASLAQQRMLFMEELAGGSSYYNMPLAFRLDGPLDKEALAGALSALLGAHDILRTVYGHARGAGQAEPQPLQMVLAPAPCAIVEHDLRGAADPEAELAAMLAADADHRFDLTCALPIRVVLITLGAQQHVLSINLHHIAADGHSARTLLADLGAAYRHCRAQPAGGAAALARRPQYADFVAWQGAWISSPQYAAARAYWLSALADAPQLHSIMPDYPRPAVQAVAGRHLRLPLAAPLAQATAQLARAHATTPFVIYQAVFAALLARYSGAGDIVFGTASANRQPGQFGATVGLFVNTLVLRYALDADTGFAALIEQAKVVNAAASRHQQFPFDALVEQLRPARSLAYNPLVQIMLVMQDEDGQALALDGVSVRACGQQQAVSKFDIALHIRSGADGVVLDWEFNTGLFAAATIERMSATFAHLLQACVDGSAGAIGALALPGQYDIDAAADLRGDAGAPVCVHRLFEQWAARQPEALALRDGEDSISYGELDQQAERVARHLAMAGAGGNSAIAVCMEKSAALVIAMLAIYKVGATYVPLDPHYPPERLAFMLQDAGAMLLLTDRARQAGDAIDSPVARRDLAYMLDTPMATAYPPCAKPEQGAYIIYTSGSTGKPKGVLVTHANLYYSLHANRAAMGIVANDLMPTIGSQAFGVSLLEIMLPLTSGGTVLLVTKAQVRDVEQLVRSSAAVTVLHAVPSLMRQWLDVLDARADAAPDPYPTLRLLLVGGESVPAGLLKRLKQWRPAVRVLALYGMTESAIVCSSFEAVLAPDGPQAHYGIGKPYRHARFHVLNDAGGQQPDGVPGELYIGGLSIAAGYVGQPAMTAERFLASPFDPGERIYRTGDRVRRLADGSFEFLGRVDHQVSLRGARIEMGEIETLAIAIDGVRQAVAHVAGADGALVLYYTSALPADAQAQLVEAIRSGLARSLPDYMRPSIVQRLDAFPLNPNGKVDRNKLPAAHTADAQVEPAGAIERRLLALSQSLLGRDDFGVTANFFEVGGHSLLAARLATRIRAEFEIAFPLTALFSSPTIRACAAVIEDGLKEKFAASLMLPAHADANLEDEVIL